MCSSDPDFPVGTQIGEYTITGVVRSSRRGSNRVYTAHTPTEKVAIKFLPLTPDTISKIESEVMMHRSLNHPRVIGYRDNFEFGQYHLLVLEFAPHESVASFIYKNRFQFLTLPEHTVKLMADQVLQGLEYMHGSGYVHGDIKPQNFLMFNEEIGDPVVKLGDLGCTRRNNGDPINDSFPGTAHYRAPEIVRRDPAGWGDKADMWSFGIALHYMLTGRFPLGIDGKRVFTSRPPLLEKLWADMPDARDLVDRLLQMDPEERPSAEDTRRHPWFLELDQGCRGLPGVGQVMTGEEPGEEFFMAGDSV